MRHRRNIRNGSDPQPHGLDSTNGVFTAGTGSLNKQLDFLYSQLLGSLDRLFRSKTRCEWRAFAGTFKPSRTRTAPGNGIAFRVGNSDNRIIKRCKNMHLTGGDGASGFLGARPSTCGTYTLSHNSSTSYFFAPRRRPRPATVFLVPLRVREFVRVRWPRTGRFRRWRMPRYDPISIRRLMLI